MICVLGLCDAEAAPWFSHCHGIATTYSRRYAASEVLHSGARDRKRASVWEIGTITVVLLLSDSLHILLIIRCLNGVLVADLQSSRIWCSDDLNFSIQPTDLLFGVPVSFVMLSALLSLKSWRHRERRHQDSSAS